MDALIAHHALPSGAVVRLRLPRLGDFASLAALAGGRGRLDEDAAQELVRFDPRRRAVACATALGDGAEQLVGVGAIDLRADATPDVVVVDDGYGEDLRELLEDVLRERAAVHDRLATARRPRRWRALGRGRARGHAA